MSKQLCVRLELRRDFGIKLSNSTLLRLEASGCFPKRLYLSSHSVAWLRSEIEAHVANLAAARRVSGR